MIIKVGSSGGGSAAVTYPLQERDAEGRLRDIPARVVTGNPGLLLVSVEASGSSSACTSIIFAEPGDVEEERFLGTCARFLHLVLGGRDPAEFLITAVLHKKLAGPRPEAEGAGIAGAESAPQVTMSEMHLEILNTHLTSGRSISVVSPRDRAAIRAFLDLEALEYGYVDALAPERLRLNGIPPAKLPAEVREKWLRLDDQVSEAAASSLTVLHRHHSQAAGREGEIPSDCTVWKRDHVLAVLEALGAEIREITPTRITVGYEKTVLTFTGPKYRADFDLRRSERLLRKREARVAVPEDERAASARRAIDYATAERAACFARQFQPLADLGVALRYGDRQRLRKTELPQGLGSAGLEEATRWDVARYYRHLVRDRPTVAFAQLAGSDRGAKLRERLRPEGFRFPAPDAQRLPVNGAEPGHVSSGTAERRPAGRDLGGHGDPDPHGGRKLKCHDYLHFLRLKRHALLELRRAAERVRAAALRARALALRIREFARRGHDLARVGSDLLAGARRFAESCRNFAERVEQDTAPRVRSAPASGRRDGRYELPAPRHPEGALPNRTPQGPVSPVSPASVRPHPLVTPPTGVPCPTDSISEKNLSRSPPGKTSSEPTFSRI